MAANIENPRNTSSFGFNNLWALMIVTLFVIIVSLNLLYPSPTGPPDNGDFARIFASFSSGPLGFEFWPPLENQDVYQKRFFNFYHRFWRYDEGKKGEVQLSTSRLFFWPGRLLNLTPGIFDLAYNAFLLTLLAGVVFYLSVKHFIGTSAVFPIGVLAFIFTDANLSGYLNSFYQESGCFFSFFCLICALHFFWARRNIFYLLIILVLALILAGTKISYTLSVLLAFLPFLVGVMVYSPRRSGLRRCVVIATILLFFGSILFMKFLWVTSGSERRDNCYHFIFTGVIPLLSTAEGKDFLSGLGLDPALIHLKGKNAYQSDSEFESEPVRSGLTKRFHLKAAFHLAIYYPTSFLKLIQFGFSRAGFYPRLQYPSLSDPSEVTSPFRWCLWSQLHGRFFNGIPYYVVSLCLILILGTLVWKRKDSGWPLFYLLAAIGFFSASLLQVIISVVGDGQVDTVKHLYFANLLLDAAFVFTLCVLIITGITFLGKSILVNRHP